MYGNINISHQTPQYTRDGPQLVIHTDLHTLCFIMHIKWFVSKTYAHWNIWSRPLTWARIEGSRV